MWTYVGPDVPIPYTSKPTITARVVITKSALIVEQQEAYDHQGQAE